MRSRRKLTALLLGAGFALALIVVGAGVAVAGGKDADDDVVAIRAAHVVTISGETIENGVVVIEKGKIESVGPAGEVKIPAGAKILEVKNGFCMPGIVNPYSRAGTFSSRRSFRGPGTGFSNKSDASLTKTLYTRQRVFEELCEVGVTTLGLVPGAGGGFTGLVSVIRPHGLKDNPTKDDLILKEGVLLRLGFRAGDAATSGLKTILSRAKSEAEKIEKAKKRRADWEKREEKKRKRDEEKRKKEAKKKKKKDGKAAADDEKKKPEKKKEGPKVPKMKANLKNIVAAREKKLRVLLELDRPNAMTHLEKALGETHEMDFLLVTSGRAAVVMKDRIVEKKLPVMLTPALATLPNSRVRVNPAAILAEAGVEICFRPTGDTIASMRGYFFNLAGLIKTGLDRKIALEGITLAPAKWLGVADRVGSLEEGKDGNVLLFAGDPLKGPLAALKYVVLNGKIVYDDDAHHGHDDAEDE